LSTPGGERDHEDRPPARRQLLDATNLGEAFVGALSFRRREDHQRQSDHREHRTREAGLHVVVALGEREVPVERGEETADHGDQQATQLLATPPNHRAPSGGQRATRVAV